MTDREKVIMGTEICLSGGLPQRCIECPYHNDGCDRQRMIDTLKLLKEQEAKWIEYPECLAYDGTYSDSHIVCSACKHVFDIMDNCTEEFDYCPHCGAKMK